MGCRRSNGSILYDHVRDRISAIDKETVVSDLSRTQAEINQQILEIIKNIHRVETLHQKNIHRVETLHQEMLSELRDRLRIVEDLITSKEQG